MHRAALRQALEDYRATWASGRPVNGHDLARERMAAAGFLEFLESTPDCFERSHPVGHLTGSALVYCPATRRVLLTLHRKLDKWLQLGGHADGCPRLDQVALQEVGEESGLSEFGFWDYEADLDVATRPLPFDLDVHLIPGELPHLHYDVRYLVRADSAQPLKVSPESKDLGWFSFEQARELCPEESMQRQFAKLEALA
jgi:hypothetical protein